MFVITLLDTILYESAHHQSETLFVMNQIIKCTTCMSNEILCVFHSNMVKASMINDVQKWLKDSDKRSF